MPKVPEFGFDCGHFEAVLIANNIVVPGSKGTLKNSMITSANLNDAAGMYYLTAAYEGSTIYHSKVHVVWVGHPRESQPFLGFKCDDPQAVVESLNRYEGKRVTLHFVLA